MRKRFLLGGFSVFAVVGILFASFPGESQAIPPFARKYKTACTTCHWGTFPKLNAFGRAFRANGLRMPGGGDEIFVREEPVKLGSSAWSRLFPKSVWPGDIPQLPAIGFKMVSEFAVTGERPHNPRGGDSGGRPEREEDTRFVGIESLEVLFGGTFGETLSFFGAGSIDELERAYLNYAPFLFGEQGHFNLRFGRLDMRGTPMSSHRKQLSLSNYMMDVMPAISAGNFFGFHPAQNGIEIWGSWSGPGGKGGLEYAAGIVNGETGEGAELFDGSGDMSTILENMVGDDGAIGGVFGGEKNKNKDWYVMVSYKIGGMGVLGEESVDDSLVASENWQDNSVRIKGYYYRGVTGAYIDNPTTGAFGNPIDGGTFDAEANRFERFGVLVDAYWRNFNFIGAASFMEDDIKGTITYGAGTFGRNLPQESGSSFHTSIYTGEVQCVVLPWLIPAFRVENVNPDYDVRDIGSFTKYSFDTTIVPRANFKILAGAHWTNYADAETGTDGMEVDRVDLGSMLDTVYRIGVDIAF